MSILSSDLYNASSSSLNFNIPKVSFLLRVIPFNRDVQILVISGDEG